MPHMRPLGIAAPESGSITELFHRVNRLLPDDQVVFTVSPDMKASEAIEHMTDLRTASSSLFALEQTLLRTRHRLLEITDEAHTTHIQISLFESLEVSEETQAGDSEIITRPPRSDALAALETVSQLLEELEQVNSDAKLKALHNLLSELKDVKDGQSGWVCIFSLYPDTVSYLHTALWDASDDSIQLTKANTVESWEEAINRLSVSGGVLVATTPILEGVSLIDADAAIYYDLPSTPYEMERLRGPIDRFGRTKPCTMYAFRDMSKAMPFEDQMLMQLRIFDQKDVASNLL